MKKEAGDVLAVIGAQYGSEGKGNLVAKVAHRYGVHVRVGGPNAGHSFKEDGILYKMQSIPCGWVNRSATLILGRGMLISVEQLFEEFKLVKAVDPTISTRLKIDVKAGILSPWHHDSAGGVEGQAHKLYGSTGEGVGVARASRITDRKMAVRREQGREHYTGGGFPLKFVPEEFRADWQRMLTHDTPGLIEEFREGGTHVLLEGTQGSGLSLIHGPWPYTSNHDSNAAQLAADAGIPPRFVNRCLLVMRTLPIRVAGNSGPLQGELSWEQVSERVGKPVKEQTTVTKKTRRIGEWDEQLVRQAVTLNAPTSIGINFMDYLSPEDEGKTEASELSEKAWSFIEYVHSLTDTPVLLVGTGGEQDWNVIKISSPMSGASWRL
jgi:adenylosuccinate synthase